MKKDKLKAFMAEYDDDDKDPRTYLLDMIKDHADLCIEYEDKLHKQTDLFTEGELERVRLNRNELFEKIAKFIWIVFEYDLETSYTVMWTIKEVKFAFSERDWKRGFKTLDEAKEFALAKSKQKSFLVEDENDNPEEVFADFKHFRIYKERNWVAAGEKKMLDKTLVSKLIKSTGKFVDEEIDKAA